MSNVSKLYEVSINQCVNLMLANRKRTNLVQGHMGSGKSSILKMLGERLPDHVMVYFDCTTKDLGDMALPVLQHVDRDGCVRFIPNEELGIHLGKPVIVMVDEYGKGGNGVKNALLRFMLEREFAGYKLHPDSVILATTNLGAEGVGDLLPPHARNRMTILRMRNSTTEEWVENFAIPQGIDPVMIAFVLDDRYKNDLAAKFDEVEDPKTNEYIYHPKDKGREAFFTWRSCHAASDWLKVRSELSTHELTSALIGTIGNKAAAELAAFVAVGDQLPSLDSIKKSPLTADVPTAPVACSMVVYRTLSCIERNWMDSWMDYLARLPRELQVMFAMQVRKNNYAKRDEVMSNAKFTKWCLDNNFIAVTDKK
jgi:hypothetical protein